jgi:hypothetical protein
MLKLEVTLIDWQFERLLLPCPCERVLHFSLKMTAAHNDRMKDNFFCCVKLFTFTEYRFFVTIHPHPPPLFLIAYRKCDSTEYTPHFFYQIEIFLYRIGTFSLSVSLTDA